MSIINDPTFEQRIIVRLAQGVWEDRDKNVVPVDQLTPRHSNGILSFIGTRANSLLEHAISIEIELSEVLLGGNSSAGSEIRALSTQHDQGMSAGQAWLRTIPAVQRLAKNVVESGANLMSDAEWAA